tara:strand:- start:3775 stop:5373 length:1599 start_codon:yes stop_codon:yes gene_type:complete
MSNKIQIFKAEEDAGLKHIIESNASIAYQAPALLHPQCDEDIACSLKATTPDHLPAFVKAAQTDDDIYHVYSILVSTSWNKNDDVFHKDEVWASKDTPKYKPTNLEHDEKQIVGGIIDNWAVDQNFDLIDENSDTNTLPDYYHILVSSVIYRQWQDPEYRDRVMDLIEKIEAGEKYVSMECMFSGFDYAVVDPNGKHHVLSRNDDTAFLTQHLRSYGGTGAYQNHQVGRLLRNITFSGKGFVDKPANPQSIIFDKNKTFEFNKASISDKSSLFTKNGVVLQVDNSNILNTQESYDMSNEILNDQIAELKVSLESVQAENKALTDKLAEANIEKYEQSIKEQAEELSVSADKVTSLTQQLEDAQSTIADLNTKFETVSEAHDKLVSHIAEMEASEKIRSRKSLLSSAGFSDEEVEAKMETFGELTDEQFTALVQTLASYVAENTKVDNSDDSAAEIVAEEVVDETADSETVEAAEEVVDTEVLETVEAEETSTLSVASDASVGSDDGIETVRAGLQDWVSTVVLNTTNSKSGE